MTALAKFRLSPLYQALLKKRRKLSNLLVQSMSQAKANLNERAKSWIYMESRGESEFCNALIARLIDAGLDRAVIDVLDQGSQCTVYLSERIGKLSNEIFNIVSEIAEAEIIAKPDETQMGLFVFSMVPKEGVDFQAYMEKMISAKQSGTKNESFQASRAGSRNSGVRVRSDVDPSFLPIRKQT